MMNDIAFCTKELCPFINCIRNQLNIKDYGIMHSWINKEDIPECPFNKKFQQGLEYGDQDTLMPAT